MSTPSEASPAVIVIGEAILERATRQVSVRGASHVLTAQESSIIDAFVERGTDATLTRLELYREAWGYSREPRGRAIDYAMRRLREKLGHPFSGGIILETIRGVGFRLVWSPAGPTHAAPPVAVVEASARRPTVLGRETLVETVWMRVQQPGTLTTLTGPGGIGKSTIARSLTERAATSVWIDLDGAPPDQLHSTICRVLFAAGRDIAPSRILPEYAAVASGPTLLVFNGCERHLDPLADILETIPAPLAVLLTSRSPLELPSERPVSIGPLQAASARQLLLDSAARLGVHHLSKSGCDVLVELLDGHPLAIQLAAAKLVTHSPSTLADALRRGGSLSRRRRRTSTRTLSVEAVAQQALERLEPQFREALHSLTVFWHPFERALAAVVLPASMDVDEVLEELAYTSMLQPAPELGPGQLRLLRPLAMAIQQLLGPPVAAQTRLLDSIASLGAQQPFRTLSLLPQSQRSLWTKRLDAVLEALGLASDPPTVELQRGLAALVCLSSEIPQLQTLQAWLQSLPASDPVALAHLALARNQNDAAAKHLASARPPASPETARLMELLRFQVAVRSQRVTPDAIHEFAVQSMDLGDAWIGAEAFRLLAEYLLLQSDLVGAAEAARSALEAARSLGHWNVLIDAWSLLGNASYLRSDTSHAQQCLTEALAVTPKHHPRRGELLGALGLVQRDLRAFRSARDSLLEGLECARKRGALQSVAVIMANLAEVEDELHGAEAGWSWATQAVDFVHQHMDAPSGAELVWGQLCILACKAGRFERAQLERKRWLHRFGTSPYPEHHALLVGLNAWIDAGMGMEERARTALSALPPLSPKRATIQKWLAAHAWLTLGDRDAAGRLAGELQHHIAEHPSPPRIHHMVDRLCSELQDRR